MPSLCWNHGSSPPPLAGPAPTPTLTWRLPTWSAPQCLPSRYVSVSAQKCARAWLRVLMWRLGGGTPMQQACGSVPELPPETNGCSVFSTAAPQTTQAEAFAKLLLQAQWDQLLPEERQCQVCVHVVWPEGACACIVSPVGRGAQTSAGSSALAISAASESPPATPIVRVL